MMNETERVRSTEDRTPTNILLEWRRVLKRTKANRTRPLPGIMMERIIRYKTMVAIDAGDNLLGLNMVSRKIEPFPVELKPALKGVAFISGRPVGFGLCIGTRKQSSPDITRPNAIWYCKHIYNGSAKHKPEYVLTTGTPYLYCEDLVENLPRYNGTAL